jgi:hypothetical protein
VAEYHPIPGPAPINPPRLARLSVPVVVWGDRFFLIDRHGERISRVLPLPDGLADLPAAAIEPWILRTLYPKEWRRWAKAVLNSQRRRGHGRDDPWQVKANCWATSLRLRQKDAKRLRAPGRVLRSDPRGTTTWEAAVRRLWTQANNAYRAATRNGWVRWAECVVNNFNKRVGGRYAPERPTEGGETEGADDQGE